jgi:hypothetical protein
MNYNRKELRKAAIEALTVAKDNLRQHGYVQPVGLVFHEPGLTNVFQFTFDGIEEKRASQVAFKQLLAKVEARAAIVVTESWIKMKPDKPLDLTVSISDDPERKEAIVVEAVSPSARLIIIQIFSKDPSGTVKFEAPFEPERPLEWSSEWLDGIIWTDSDDHRIHGLARHKAVRRTRGSN